MTEHPGPIEQLRMARANPAAGLMGALLGGLVPAVTFTVAHSEFPEWGHTPLSAEDLATMPAAWIVGAGLVFSAKTVWSWGHLAFRDMWKATGFVLLTEGVLVFSQVEWLRWLVFTYLLAINAVATGCNLALRSGQGAYRSGPETAAELSDVTLEVVADTISDEPEQTSPEALAPVADDLYRRALAHLRNGVAETSISSLQKGLRVGHTRAKALVEQLSAEGVVGGAGQNSLRPVLPLQVERRYRALGGTGPVDRDLCERQR